LLASLSSAGVLPFQSVRPVIEVASERLAIGGHVAVSEEQNFG
jgi:hypothetical protein